MHVKIFCILLWSYQAAEAICLIHCYLYPSGNEKLIYIFYHQVLSKGNFKTINIALKQTLTQSLEYKQIIPSFLTMVSDTANSPRITSHLLYLNSKHEIFTLFVTLCSLDQFPELKVRVPEFWYQEDCAFCTIFPSSVNNSANCTSDKINKF